MRVWVSNMKKIIILCMSATLLLTGCGNKTEVSRHLIDSKTQYTCSYKPKKTLTELTALNPKDTRSRAEKILERLDSGIDADLGAPTVNFDIGDFSFTKIEPKCNNITFYLCSFCDAKDVQIVFYFDKGENSCITVPVAPAGQVMLLSARMPKDAKKVGIKGLTFAPCTVKYLNSKIYLKDNKLGYELESNNTLHFDTHERTRFFVLDNYGIILDDVTLYGSGDFVTGNGAAALQEFLVKDK